MKSYAAASLLCASLLASCTAKPDGDRSAATVHLLGPLAGASSSTQSHGSTGSSSTIASSHAGKEGLKYSPSDANALVSSFLRIEEYEVLRDGLDVPEQLTLRPLQELEGGENSNTQPLMLVSEDMSSYGINSIFPSLEDPACALATRLVHSFEVASAPSGKAWMELLETYRTRIAEKSGLKLDDVKETQKEKRMMMPPVPGSLGGYMALGSELLDDAYIPYIQSLQKLVDLQEDSSADVASIPVLHLKGLKNIASKYGIDSKELMQAAEILSITAESVVASYPGKVLIVNLPVRQQHGHKQSRSERSSSHVFSTRPSKRSYAKRDDLSTAASIKPIVPTVGICYESQEACSNTTSSCYGHGQCVQGRKVGSPPAGECWVCQCASTKGDDGKTQYWSGAMCQKKDISSSFFLLAGSVFLLLFITVASVALLGGVGSEALPSTLAALGGSGGHRKHE